MGLPDRMQFEDQQAAPTALGTAGLSRDIPIHRYANVRTACRREVGDTAGLKPTLRTGVTLPTVFCVCLSTLLVGLLFHMTVFAQTTVPLLLPFQGRLTDQNGVAVADGARVMQFKIFNAPVGGTPVWAGEVHKTTVNGGLVNVLLGSKTPLAGLDFNTPFILR